MIYEYTASRWDLDTEKAPYSLSQCENIGNIFRSLIQRVDDRFISLTTSDNVIVDDKSRRMCTWSTPPLTIMGLHPLRLTIPAMKENNSARCYLSRVASRPFVEKTMWYNATM